MAHATHLILIPYFAILLIFIHVQTKDVFITYENNIYYFFFFIKLIRRDQFKCIIL